MLRLTLENATGLPATVAASIDFGDRETLTIGRSEGLDWTLPDPSRLMSGSHCEIRRSADTSDTYLLYDRSTNGTFLAGSKTRLDSPHTLHDGEGLLIGAYLIRVELTEETGQALDDKTRLVPRPVTEPRLQLTINHPPALADQRPLTATLGGQGVLRIGRDDSADWTLPDPTGSISREHCSIRFANGAFVLEDSSSNGTFVNHSVERLSGSYRLRDGDRLLIGVYLITVQVSGVADDAPSVAAGQQAESPAASPAPAEPPPGPPAPVRPSSGARRGGDPAAMLADAPAIAPRPVARAGDPLAAGGSQAEDGVTRIARVDKTPPAPAAAAPVAGINEAADAAPAVADRMAKPAAASDGTGQPSAGDQVLAGIARGLGLSPADFDEADAALLGERMGELILLLTDEIRQLLALRDAALGQPTGHRHGARAGSGASNPLTLLPTSEEALRVLFGPPRRAYLDSRESFEASLTDLRHYCRQTDAAIRAAAVTLSNELAPAAIDKAAGAESRLGQLLISRKARLWDLYVERWNSRPPLQPDRPVASFIQAFGGATDQND